MKRFWGPQLPLQMPAHYRVHKPQQALDTYGVPGSYLNRYSHKNALRIG